MPMTLQPTRDRPKLPQGYKIPAADDGMLPWEWVDERLERSKNYWIATATNDGQPLARPLWGVWLDSQLYFEGSPLTRWGRLISVNPRIQVNLESGNEVVIIEGQVADEVDVGEERYQRVTDQYAAKYNGYRPEDHGFFVVTPRKILAWAAFPDTLTRFRFQ
jgi:nitroimidazol reductase NimA-like FMN-containing flavoprotein (pyridoxamine 5'-phosphate oxidase superfamily)